MGKKQQNKKGKIGRKTVFVLAGAIVALAAIAVIVVCLAGGPSEQERPVFKVHTPHMDLILPLELEGVITSDESTYNGVYTRGFYMNYNGEEIPLWRVDFGDSKSVDWIGRLQTNAGDVAIAMTGFAISNEDLAALGEEGAILYGDCMQGYTVMMEGIMSDSRFTTERPLAVGEDKKVKLTYWTVTLPDKITVQESNNGGNYEAMFTGEVAGEMVLLYRIRIGQQEIGSMLGYYEVNGVKTPIFIESYALANRESWSEDDYATANRMMATVNDVILQITASKDYSEFSEE